MEEIQNRGSALPRAQSRGTTDNRWVGDSRIKDIAYFKSAKFRAINLWAHPNLEELIRTLQERIDSSTQSLSIKPMLANATSKYLTALDKWCVSPPPKLQNFRDFCGLSMHQSKLTGKLPSPRVQYSLLNIYILDALLDATREPDDTEGQTPSSSPSESMLVQKTVKPKSGISSKRSFRDTLKVFIGQLGHVETFHKPGSTSPTMDLSDETAKQKENVDEILSELYRESKRTSMAANKLKVQSHILHLALLLRTWCTVSEIFSYT